MKRQLAFLSDILDDRGQATIEGVGAAVVMILVFVMVVLFARYGSAIIRAQGASRAVAMGAASPAGVWPSNPGAVHVDEPSFRDEHYQPSLMNRWNAVGFNSGSGVLGHDVEGLAVGEREVSVEDRVRGSGPAPGGGFQPTELAFRARYWATQHCWRSDYRMTEDSLHAIYSNVLFSSAVHDDSLQDAHGLGAPPSPVLGLERYLFGELKF